MGLVILLMGSATYTDIRWRRIPNLLTFPAIGLGWALHLATGGWTGLVLSVAGSVLAPCVLVLAHAGRGIGMGDIKLSAGIGALLGPGLGILAMLLSMIAGAGVAMVWMMKEWGMFGHGWVSISVGRLFPASWRREGKAENKDVSGVTIPYGVALTIGTLLTLVVSLWTGKTWFL
jgi:prepilin peptidase CpaA